MKKSLFLNFIAIVLTIAATVAVTNHRAAPVVTASTIAQATAAPSLYPLLARAPAPEMQYPSPTAQATQPQPDVDDRDPAVPTVPIVEPPAAIAPSLLARLIRACAPDSNEITQAAIVANESNGDAWVLHDDNSGYTYRAPSYDAAVTIATNLIENNRRAFGSRDAGVDVGLGQINSNNFRALGVDAAMMLHPCANLKISSRMIAAAYNTQYATLSGVEPAKRDHLAIRRALQVYNSGRPFGDEAYVRNVLIALHSPIVRSMRMLSYEPPPVVPVVPILAPVDTTAFLGPTTSASDRRARNASDRFLRNDGAAIAHSHGSAFFQNADAVQDDVAPAPSSTSAATPTEPPPNQLTIPSYVHPQPIGPTTAATAAP